MKIRYFFLVAFLMLLAVGNSIAQAVQEKTPVNLQGVWQMCFYRSNSPDRYAPCKHLSRNPSPSYVPAGHPKSLRNLSVY